MALNTSNFFYFTLVFSFIYAIYYVHWQFTTGVARRRLIAKYGCKPIQPTYEWNTLNRSIFGWQGFRERLAAYRDHRLLEYSCERFRRHGNTIPRRTLTTNTISTIEPENLKTILATNFNDWSFSKWRKDAFVPLLGHGIFTTDGAAWRHSRELLRPNFNRNQVSDLAMLEVHIGHLMQAISKDGSALNLQDLFFKLTIDSATEFLFGESTNCLLPNRLNESKIARFAEAWDRALIHIGHGARYGPLVAYFRKSSFSKDAKVAHELVDTYVQRGLEYRESRDPEKVDSEQGERYVFLHELVKTTKDPVRIKSELLNILLAGRDTTASLLSNTWFVLARRADVWVKLREEVDQLGGMLPTLEQIKGMKYLRAVFNESLRLYPPVPGNARMAVVDTILPLGGGPDRKSPLLIPAKTMVEYSLYSMHRRKDLYGEDADEYRPERWESLRPGWEYLPFNGGPRICIGQQFALAEASYTTIRLMQVFKSVKSRDPEPWQESMALTCAGRNGVKVSLTLE